VKNRSDNFAASSSPHQDHLQTSTRLPLRRGRPRLRCGRIPFAALGHGARAAKKRSNAIDRPERTFPMLRRIVVPQLSRSVPATEIAPALERVHDWTLVGVAKHVSPAHGMRWAMRGFSISLGDGVMPVFQTPLAQLLPGPGVRPV
jgi:hypothetical protein